MKNLILLSFVILVILNTVIGILFETMDIFNVFITDISLLSSALLIILLYTVPLVDGFKFGLTIFFSFTAIIKYFLCFFSPYYISQNIPLIITLILLSVEALLFLIVKTVNNK